MDHAYIDEQQVAERYLMGRLSPEEAQRFEEHSLACAECLDRLEAAEELRLGLRDAAARQAAGAAVQLGLLARLVRSRLAPWGLAALFLAALLPSGLLLREVGQRERELDEARAALAARPAPPPEPATPDAGAETAGLRRQVAEQQREIQEHRQAREQLAADLQQARQPRVNVPVVPLAPERAGAGAPDGPATRLALSPAAEWVVLALQLDAAPGRYRATLRGADGRTRWQSDDLRPDAEGTCTAVLPSDLLAAGDYTIQVEELPRQGEPVPAAELAFRVVRGR